MFVKVYHITAVENLDSILTEGIFSRHAMDSSEQEFHDIAAEGALNNHRLAKIDGKPIEEFARCFFNPLPPMYRMRKDTEDLAVIELRIPVKKVFKTYNSRKREFHNLEIEGVRWPYVRIFRKSISSYGGDLEGKEVHNLKKIHWDSSIDAYDKDRNLAIAQRGAEIAVPDRIPAEYIAKVYRTEKELNSLERLCNLGKPEIIGDDDD